MKNYPAMHYSDCSKTVLSLLVFKGLHEKPYNLQGLYVEARRKLVRLLGLNYWALLNFF